MRLRLGAAGAVTLCAGVASQTPAAGPSTSPLEVTCDAEAQRRAGAFPFV